ncbi:MAG TPA: nitroreductase family protein [Syntrophorhabdaceae bacterium]|nr:nitroreductase family protein [Syntrophorhabdaceae bacterium]
MTINELAAKSRSYRRFYQDELISTAQLKGLIELARLSPSSANLQPLKFILSNDAGKNDAIFSCLAWAGYLKDWPGPEEGERPSGYVIILGDTSIAKDFGCNHGIAAQSILLGATEMGFGGCMIANIQRGRLATLLGIPERYQILLAIALGKPKEQVVITDVKDGDIKYWRDAGQVHYVPKRTLDELILDL